eukprot:COSAG02_NODE_556_length_20390_cov_88.575230_6_plen_128_part_00
MYVCFRHYYQAAMVQLYTKYDSNADTSGSCGLITRRKDFHAPTRDFEYPDPAGEDTRVGTADLSEQYNPKQEVIRQAFTDKDATESGEFELLDNIWLRARASRTGSGEHLAPLTTRLRRPRSSGTRV